MQQPMSGAAVDFQAGTVIFREGEPGGDLFFIKEGEVEVYRESKGLSVRLAILKAGEVLGIMTCLTREPRLASARALTPVKALVVKQAGLKTLITSTPAWVSTVIKDFTVRVKNIDELYTQACQRLESQEMDLSNVRLAAMVARGLGELGAMTATTVGDAKVVDIDAVLDRLARILDVSSARITYVFEVFLSSGLLLAGDSARPRRASLGVLERLGGFADAARRYLSSSADRTALEQLSDRDRRYLSAVCDSLKAQKFQLIQECSLPISKLVVDGVAAEAAIEILRRAAVAGLVRMESTPNETLVTFTPSHLGSLVHALVAIETFRQADRSRSKGDPLPAVAALA